MRLNHSRGCALAVAGMLILTLALDGAVQNPAHAVVLAAPLRQDAGFEGIWTIDLGSAGTGNLNLSLDGDSISGTYRTSRARNGRISGTVVGSTASGRWSDSRGSGTFRLTLVSDAGQQFRGNADGRNPWCGWRSGKSKPNPCFRK